MRHMAHSPPTHPFVPPREAVAALGDMVRHSGRDDAGETRRAPAFIRPSETHQLRNVSPYLPYLLRRFDVTVSSLGGLLIVRAAWLCRASEGSSGNIRLKNEHEVVIVLVTLPLDFGIAKHVPSLNPTLYYVIF
jgi:hypothetical protein